MLLQVSEEGEIKEAMDAQVDGGLYDTVDDVQVEKDSGFLLYEDGCWNQYMEDMTTSR